MRQRGAVSAVAEHVIEVLVSCQAGHQGEETPVDFTIGDRRIGVAEVLDRWLAPDHRYFKLRGDDSALYILRHDVAGESWELILYNRTGMVG